MNSRINKICGCELNNPDPERFDITVSGQRTTSDERLATYECFASWMSCPAECIDPEVRCLIPKGSELYKLGCKETEDGVSITYFASEKNGETVFFRLSEPVYRWAAISRVEKDEVPYWAISAFES